MTGSSQEASASSYEEESLAQDEEVLVQVEQESFAQAEASALAQEVASYLVAHGEASYFEMGASEEAAYLWVVLVIQVGFESMVQKW